MLTTIYFVLRVSYTLFLFLFIEEKILAFSTNVTNLEKTYKEIDKLFAKIQIRKTNLDKDKAKIITLKKLMSGTTKKDKIIKIVTEEYESFSKEILAIISCYELNDFNECLELSKKNSFLKRKLKIEENFKTNIKNMQKIHTALKKINKNIDKKFNNKLFDIMDSIKNVSLHKYLRVLVNNNFIPIEVHILIMNKYSYLNINELNKLFENGALLKNNNILLELKIGDIYGDIDKANDSINLYVNNLKNNDILNLNNINDNELYLSELRRLCRDELISELIDNSAVINQIRRHFFIFGLIGSAAGFSPMSAGSLSAVNPLNSFNSIVSANTLSWNIINNHYFTNNNNSINNNIYIGVSGYSYSNVVSFNNEYGTSFWGTYSNNYLAFGTNFTYNLPEGTSWSNSEPTFLNFGAIFYGWRDQIGIGINAQTLLANSIGLGISLGVSKTIFHDVSYLGQYPLDGRIAQLRGMHKIEINHLSGTALKAGITVNGSSQNVPVSVAFRTGINKNTKHVFRTYVEKDEAVKMLEESNVPGAFYILGKKIKESNIPNFDNPELLKDGEELIEIKSGSLMGSFVVGLESYVPIYAFRIGANIEILGEFELGLRKLPNNKYEVSVEPIKILEGSLFESMLNIFSAGQISRVAVAKKQVFLFDFNNPLAKLAYNKLIYDGQLPTQEDISIYYHDKAAEYLLHEFRAHNKEISPNGVARIYLEHINLEAKKFFVGFQIPILSATINIASIINNRILHNRIPLNIQFNGYDIELMGAESTSISTNGIVAIEKKTTALMSSANQGFNGSMNKEFFVTHKRIYTIEEKDNNTINKWDFDNVTVALHFIDSQVTNNDENKMVNKINRLFNANIDYFSSYNTRQPRTIMIQKILTKEDIYLLNKSHENITIASKISKIDSNQLSSLIQKLKYKHYDEQGLIIKDFIALHRIKGFAAINALLGSDIEKLQINTESNYLEAILDAQAFIIKFLNNNDNEKKRISFDARDNKKNKQEIEEFYKGLRIHLSNIDYKLRLLYDDKYFIDANSSIHKILTEEKIKNIIEKGIRQDKKTLAFALVTIHSFLLSMIDYESQGFSHEQIIKILKMVDKKNLRLLEKIVLLNDKYKENINAEDSTKNLQKRFRKVWYILEKIDNRIEELSNDRVMLEMNKDYCLKYIQELNEAKEKLSSLINLEHLEKEEIALLKNKFNNPLRNFFKKNNRNNLRIEGYLRGAKIHEYQSDTFNKKGYLTKNNSCKDVKNQSRRYKNKSLNHLSNINESEYRSAGDQIIRNGDISSIYIYNDYQ